MLRHVYNCRWVLAHLANAKDLNLGCSSFSLAWTTVIIPRYLSYIASLENPWDTDSKGKEVDMLQRFWLEAFGEHLKSEDDVRKVRDIVSTSFCIW